MKSANPWTTYRTRFLVQAKQLNTSLTFTDVLGRVHSGRRGDYLVESSDGVLRIAPRQIFEDIYVALHPDETSERSLAESRADSNVTQAVTQQIFRTETSRKTPILDSGSPNN